MLKYHQNQSPFNLKTLFSRVLSRMKQTIASIKLLIGIGKQGRRTVDNQSRYVLPLYRFINQFVYQNNGVNDTCQINKRALCTSMTHVLIAIRGLSS